MARSDVALRHVRGAYEGAFIGAAIRGVALALVLTLAAVALHRTTEATWIASAALAATLATVAWRGGAWARGGLAGVLAGIPVFIAPAIYFMVTAGNCPDCHVTPTLTCMLVCIGTSAGAGMLVGHIASHDEAPRRFALAAVATASLAGLLGCGTTGLAGGVGVVLGVIAGGVTGWVTAARTVRA